MRLTTLFKPTALLRQYRLNWLLAEFSRRAGECESAVEIYDVMESSLRKILDFDRITIRLIDDAAGTIIDTYYSGQSLDHWNQSEPRPLPGTATEAVVSSENPLLLNDCRSPEIVQRFPALAPSAERLPSLLGVPLIYRGSVIGAMQIRSARANAFSKGEVQMMVTAAAHIAPTVVNSAQREQLQSELRERSVVAEIGRTVSSTIDFSSAWDQFVTSVKSLMPCDRLVVALVSDGEATIVDRYVWGVPLPNWDETPKRRLQGVPSERVLLSRHAEIISTEESDRITCELMGYNMSERTGLNSAMYAPLIAGDRIIGTLNVKALQPEAYTAGDLALLERLALQVGGSVAAAELYSRTVRLAEEKAARAELESKNRQLTESSDSRARFISTISHELRTPLTSIIAFLDIMNRDKNDAMSEKDAQYLEVIRRNAERLRILIEDLLDISSMESGNLRLDESEFTVQESVDDVAMSVKPMIDSKAQRLITEFSEPDIGLMSDRTRVDQILSNLILNASKYSKEYQEIKVAAAIRDGEVRIAVIDHGDGMTADEISLIFKEFARLDNAATKASQGRGLGLAVSRQLARAMGGDIHVTSEKGKGSIFVLTVPARLEKAA